MKDDTQHTRHEDKYLHSFKVQFPERRKRLLKPRIRREKTLRAERTLYPKKKKTVTKLRDLRP